MALPKHDYIRLTQEEISTKNTPTLSDCQTCKSRCCNYVMIDWDTPTEEADFDNLRWFIAHRDASVHVDEGEWCVEFKMPCEKLAPDGKCTVYDIRPQMCRDYASNMLKDGLCGGFQNIYETFDHYFETLEELDAFIPGYLDSLIDTTLWDKFKDFFEICFKKLAFRSVEE